MRLKVILWLSLMVTLQGCSLMNAEGNDNLDKTEETITYQTGSHDGSNIDSVDYANITITDYEYSPFTGRLCFNINITDTTYRASEYFIIQRERGSMLTESQVSFTIDSEIDTVYHCAGYSVEDELVIGKRNSWSNKSIFESMDVLAWIIVDDSFAEDRLRPEGGHFIVKQPSPSSPVDFEFESIIGSPYIMLEYLLTDPHRVREGLFIEVYFRPFDIIVKQLEIPFTEDMYEGDQLKIEDIIIRDLPPNVSFEVHFYLKGSDGIDVYDYTHAGYRIATSSTTGFTAMTKNAYPGLYSDIKGFEIGEDSTIITYELFNPGKVKHDNEPVTLSLTNADRDFTIELDPNETTVSVNNTLLDQFDALQIIVNETNEVLSQYNFNFNFYSLFEFSSYHNGIFEYMLDDFPVEVLSIDLAFKLTRDGDIIARGTIVDIPETFEFGEFDTIAVGDIPYTSSDYVFVEYTVTYIGFNGVETHTRQVTTKIIK
jgi:hypothetical protein